MKDQTCLDTMTTSLVKGLLPLGGIYKPYQDTYREEHCGSLFLTAGAREWMVTGAKMGPAVAFTAGWDADVLDATQARIYGR